MQLDNLFEVIKQAGQKPFASFLNRYVSAWYKEVLLIEI